MVNHITSKNRASFTKEVKVLQQFYLQGGSIAKPGDIITLRGHNLLDALNRKLVEEYQEECPEKKESKKKRAKD